MSEALQYHKEGLIFASLADAYIEKGMYEDAMKLLKEGITLHPNYSYAHRLLAICYYQKQDLTNAEQEFKEALKDPSDIKARYFLTKIYLVQNNIDQARKTYEEIKKVAPDSEEAKQLSSEFEIPQEKPEEPPKEFKEDVIDVEGVLKELTSLDPIDSVLLIEKDGLLIAADNIENGDEIAGLISGIANQCWLTGSDFGIGDLKSFSITTADQNMVSLIGPDAILTVITKIKSTEGLATLYSTRFHDRITNLLQR